MRYTRPRTIEEPLTLLTGGDGARLLAGGTVIVPEITRLGSAGLTMIDIGRIEALQTMGQEDGSLRIGATVRLARWAASLQVQNG